jgi:hypothetical protein
MDDYLPAGTSITTVPTERPFEDMTRPPVMQAPARDYGVDTSTSTNQQPDVGVWRAGWELDTIPGAMLNRRDAGISFEDDGTDPFASNKGTKFEQMPEYFTDIFNKQALAARREQIEREQELRAVQDRSPWGAAGASLALQVLDPTILIPGAGLVKVGRGVYRFAGSAAKVGAAAAGATAVQEAVLQSQQQLRTGEESAVAIGGSFVLGGMLGGGLSLLTRPEVRRATTGLDSILNTRPGPDGTVAAGSGAALTDMAMKLRAGERVTTEEIQEWAKSARIEARNGRDATPETMARWEEIDRLSARLEQEASVARSSEIEIAARQAFSGDGDRLVRGGGLSVVQSVEDLPARSDGLAHPTDVRGVFDGSKAYIVADNVAPDEVPSVLLHEVGVHFGMERMVGADNFRVLLDDVMNRATAGEARFAEAMAAVPKDTPSAHVAEEVLAYLVENAPETGIVQRVIAAVKQFIRQVTGGAYSNLSEAEIRQLAVSSLRKWNPEARPSQIAEPRYSLSKLAKASDGRVKVGAVLRDVDRGGLNRVERGIMRQINGLVDAGKWAEATVPIRSIYGTQEFVNADFKAAAAAREAGDLPLVVRLPDGNMFARDGHHRLVAAADAGEQVVRVRLVDLKAIDDEGQLPLAGIAGETADVRYSRSKKVVEDVVSEDRGKDATYAPLDRLVGNNRVPYIDWRDLKGRVIFPTIADRTGAGALYKGIDGSELKMAIHLPGGPNYPFRESNMDAGVVWANKGKGVSATKAERAKQGQLMAVLLGDANMHQSNATVSKAFFQTVEAYVRDGRISQENIGKIDDYVRQTFDDFPGIESEAQFDRWADALSFEDRKRFIKVLGGKKVQGWGGPSLQKVLDATRDPEFGGNRWGDAVIIVEPDPSQPLVRLGDDGTTPHPDYPTGIRGRVIGKLRTPINYETLWREWLSGKEAQKAAEQAAKEDGADAKVPNLRRAFELAKPAVTVTDDIISRMGDAETKFIKSQRQAKLLLAMGADDWRKSGVTITKGGISPQEFVDAINDSAASASLSKYTAKEVEQAVKAGTMRVFQLGKDGRVWFALKKGNPASDYKLDPKKFGYGDNEVSLTSVVGNEQGVPGVAGPSVVLKALQEGATALDAFAVQSSRYPNGFLPSFYRRFGFEEVGRTKFNPKFYNANEMADLKKFWKSTGWDEKSGYPDVVLMKWRGTDADRAGITGRYLNGGEDGFLAGRTSGNVKAAADSILGDRGGRAARQSEAVPGGNRGLQGDAGSRLAGNLGNAFDELKGLSDDGLRNFGLTRADIDSLKYSRGSSRNERIAAQAETLAKAIQSIDDPAAFSAALAARGGSVGAEIVDKETREDLAIYGKPANAVASVAAFLNPILRTRTSPVAAVNRIGQKLFSDTIYSNMHMQGRTMGPAAEDFIKSQAQAMMGEAAQKYEALYQEGRKAGMRLTKTQFSEAISAAMRRKDEHEVPAVAKAAKMWRDVVFDPLKRMAQETRIKGGYLLDPDIETKFADSYLHRMANHKKLTADEPGFKNAVAGYMEGMMRGQYAKEADEVRARLAAFEQDKADLSLDPDTRIAEMEGLDKAYEDLDLRFSREADMRREISNLNSKAVLARRAGDKGAMKAAYEEIRRVKASGGKEFDDYMRQFYTLNRRRKNVDLGFAGMAERQDEMAQKLEDVNDANLRAMDRLVARGQKLERDLAKLDPITRSERIAELREQLTGVLERQDKAAERLFKQVENAEKAKARAALQVLKEKRAGGIKEVLAADTEAKFATETVKTPGKSRSPTERTIRPRGLPEYDGLNMVGLHYTEAPEGFFISGSYLPAEMRNKGLGKAMYETLVAEAQRAGKPIFSDGDVSFDAARVYKSLQKKGAKVTDSTEYYDGMDKHYGKDGPAFRIDPPPLQSEKALDEQIRKYVAAEQKRSDKLGAIRNRIDRLDGLDLDGQAAELRAAMNEITKQQSDLSIGRGERSQRLKDRYAKFDPAQVQKRIAEIDARVGQVKQEFYRKWEIERAGEGVDLHSLVATPKFTEWAKSVADDAFDFYSGRAPEAGTVPDFLAPIKSGPLKERTLPVPDQILEPWLENDIGSIANKYVRSMLGQIEVARKFGSTTLDDEIAEVTDAYRATREMVNAAPDAKAAVEAVGQSPSMKDAFEAWRRGDAEAKVTKERIVTWLEKREQSDKDDIRAGRDLLLGRYAMEENQSDLGKLSRVAIAYNFARYMGGYIIGSLTDIYRPAMVHGLGHYLNHGIKPLLTNLEGVKLAAKEAQKAGIGVERWTHSYVTSAAGIGDPYAQGTALERFMDKVSKTAATWNGMTVFNDFTRSVGGIDAMDKILIAATKKTDTPYLAMLGIDPGMAQRIADQFKLYGRDIRGTLVAETDNWTDKEAVRIFRTAVSKDVNSMFVERSVGDVPLFVNRPLGRMITQFRTFNLASNQRVLMRGLQEDQARFVGAMVAMTTIGMAVAALRSWRGGDDRWEKFKKSAENPGFLIGEGLDNSGIFALFFEGANTIEKLSQPSGVSFNPIKAPLRMAFPGSTQTGESTRFVRRSPLESVLGPSAGIPQQVAQALGGDAKAMTSLTPGASHSPFRELIQALSGNSAYGF